MTQPRIYSGMQPSSGSLHLGNYVGALMHWRQLQSESQAFFSIVDLHALTSIQDPTVLRQQVRTLAAQYIAGGIDPDSSCLYVQSHVAAHAQMAWLLSIVTGFGEASRMTQFKDKTAKKGMEAANVGLFTYPILMAGDILLYDANLVPVGADQKQHVELTRDIGDRFNKRYGKTFVIPEPLISEDNARIMDLQDPIRKMSKSAETDKGIIWLLDEPTEGLDAATARDVLQRLQSRAQQRTVVLCTHLQREAALADRLIWLDGGVVQAEARRGEPAFAALIARLRPD